MCLSLSVSLLSAFAFVFVFVFVSRCPLSPRARVALFVFRRLRALASRCCGRLSLFRRSLVCLSVPWPRTQDLLYVYVLMLMQLFGHRVAQAENHGRKGSQKQDMNSLATP